MPNPEVRVEEVVYRVMIEDRGVDLVLSSPAEVRLVVGEQGPPGPPGAGLEVVDGGTFDGGA